VQARQALQGRVVRDLNARRAGCQSDVAELVRAQSKLQEGIDGSDTALAAVQVEQTELRELIEAAKARLEELRARAEQPVESRSALDFVKPVDVGSAQLLRESSLADAYDDALYALYRSMGSGSLSATDFIAEVRRQSRRKFMHTALSRKIMIEMRGR
jgi:hypothetical protein